MAYISLLVAIFSNLHQTNFNPHKKLYSPFQIFLEWIRFWASFFDIAAYRLEIATLICHVFFFFLKKNNKSNRNDGAWLTLL